MQPVKPKLVYTTFPVTVAQLCTALQIRASLVGDQRVTRIAFTMCGSRLVHKGIHCVPNRSVNVIVIT